MRKNRGKIHRQQNSGSLTNSSFRKNSNQHFHQFIWTATVSCCGICFRNKKRLGLILCLIWLYVWAFSLQYHVLVYKEASPESHSRSSPSLTSSTPNISWNDVVTDSKSPSTNDNNGGRSGSSTTLNKGESASYSSFPSNNVESNKTSQFSTFPSSSCQPTHKACVGYDGFYHIKMGDYGGAGGTIFFQFVISQLIYAEKHNLLPFVHFNNYSYLIYDNDVHTGDGMTIDITVSDRIAKVSTLQDPRWHRALYPGPPQIDNLQQQQQQPLRSKTYHLAGDGVWEHYFSPVSDYCPGDKSCMKVPYVTMVPEQISPGLHLYASWAPKIWRYGPLPAFIAQPHIPLTTWLTPQRIQGHNTVKKFYRFQPWLLQKSQLRPLLGPSRHASKVHEMDDHSSRARASFCLGMHVRWSDKGASRRKLGINEFFPFVQAYMDQFDNNISNNNDNATSMQPCIYLATDAQSVISYIRDNWPLSYQSALITSQASIRSPNETAVFNMASHHQTNTEVLIDIMDLSYCQFMLHGNSAVSEAAIYLNGPNLIYQSVNIEDPQRPWTPQTFGQLVQDVVFTKNVTSDYWETMHQAPKQWWEETGPSLQQDQVRICQGGGEADVFFNITLQLYWTSQTTSEPRYSLPISKIISRLFLDLANHLQYAKSHDMVPLMYDSVWHSWFERTCHTVKPSNDIAIVSIGNLTSNYTKTLRPSWRYFQKRQHDTTTVSFQGWFNPIRQVVSQLLQSFFRFRPYVIQQARQIISDLMLQDEILMSQSRLSSCLGLHIPDPGYKRNTKLKQWVQKKYPGATYYAYVDAYRQAGGRCVYLSTDSYSIWKEWFNLQFSSLELVNNVTGKTVNESTISYTNGSRDDTHKDGLRHTLRYYTQSEAVRNRENVPAHYMEPSIHRLVSEALVDIWNLASCGILVHGSHHIADAALFWNANLPSFHVQDSKPNELPSKILQLQRIVHLDSSSQNE